MSSSVKFISEKIYQKKLNVNYRCMVNRTCVAWQWKDNLIRKGHQKQVDVMVLFNFDENFADQGNSTSMPGIAL